MQAGFATRFLRALRQWGIHTAIETAGDAAFSRIYPLAQACDEVLFDLKIMDPGQARKQLAMNLPGCWKISAGWWKMAFTSSQSAAHSWLYPV
jgi:pyruvate-formate lyase-activating enzyme